MSIRDIKLTFGNESRVKFKNQRYVKIFCISMFVFFCLSCGNIIKTVTQSLMQVTPPQLISGPISIGNDALEISPAQPFKSITSPNSISIDLDNVAHFDLQGKKKNTVILEDGKELIIDASIFDAEGKEYKLYISTVFKGFSLSYGSEDNHLWLPDNTTFTKFKIKTNVPATFKKIEWVTHQTK